MSQSMAPLILVADDDDQVRLLVRRALEQANFRVCDAEDGARALQLFEIHRPDIVILDVIMPLMDGLTACSKLRQSAGGRRVPILIMTGVDDSSSVTRAYEHGATDFIGKPLSLEDLIQRVRYLLRGIDETEALLRSEARLELAQRIAKIGNWEWHPRSNIFQASSEFCRLLNISADEFEGSLESFLGIVHPDYRSRVGKVLHDLVETKASCDLDLPLVLPCGVNLTVNLQAEVGFDSKRNSSMVLGTVQDISERKRVEQETKRLAYFDSVTGLPNRSLFKDRLTQALSYARRYKTMLATMFVDLDRFKAINDTLGHNVGDMLLQGVAERLKESVRYSDSIGRIGEHEVTNDVARLGGDEFTVLLSHVCDTQDAGKIARRMLESLARPFLINGRELFVTASIGIANYPSDGDSVDVLLERADSAMYHAKKQGRNNYQFYSNTLNAEEKNRLLLEVELRRGIEREEFAVYYQPRVELRTRRLVGAEALVRWRHPKRGLLGPQEFLGTAIETGMIRAIDEWILERICLQNLEWQDRRLSPIPISMNVSKSLFHGQSMLTIVQEVLRKTGMDPSLLELELTEAIMMRNWDSSIEMLQQLQAQGVQLAVDDFGVGVSSLSYLPRLPIQSVTIDRSVVQGIPAVPEQAQLAKAIILLAHGLKLQVRAEGVEREEQRAFLIAEACDQGQGYLFGRPIPSEDFAQLMSPLALPKAG